MAQQQPTPEELRTGARIFSTVAALSAVGYIFAPAPWRYLLAAIAVVCFIRSVFYFFKAKKAGDSQ